MTPAIPGVKHLAPLNDSDAGNELIFQMYPSERGVGSANFIPTFTTFITQSPSGLKVTFEAADIKFPQPINSGSFAFTRPLI